MAALPHLPERADTKTATRMEALSRLDDTDHDTDHDTYHDEPECQCARSDVDLFDATPCEFHNPRSRWNERMRAVTDIGRLEAFSDLECPF